MWKQISKEKAWDMIKENGYKPIRAILTDAKPKNFNPTFLIAVSVQEDDLPSFQAAITYNWYRNCYIEVSDEYRYMTKEEQLDWVITVGYKNHQMRFKDGVWFIPVNVDTVESYEYRTVEMINGKIVYGEPKEFKVKVDE